MLTLDRRRSNVAANERGLAMSHTQVMQSTNARFFNRAIYTLIQRERERSAVTSRYNLLAIMRRSRDLFTSSRTYEEITVRCTEIKRKVLEIVYTELGGNNSSCVSLATLCRRATIRK